jgi:hypothetical protein
MQQATNQIPNPVSLTHEQPNNHLEPEQPSNSGSGLGKVFIILTLGALAIILVLAIGGGLFLWPKAQTVKFASSTRESISGLFTEMDTVNSSLNSLYKYATSDDDNVTLTRLSSTFGEFNNVFAAYMGIDPINKDSPDNRLGTRLKSFLTELKDIFKDVEISKDGKVDLGEKVKGFTTPADDPNKVYRDQRDLAVKVSDSTGSSETELKEFETNLEGGTPESLSSLNENLNSLKDDSKTYLSESKKTADYYVLTSDLAIELEGNFDAFLLALESANSVNSLVASFDDISKDLKKLKKELEDVDSSELPMEIEDLHNDTIKLFDISIDFFDQMKILTLKADAVGMENLLVQTTIELNQLVILGSDDEISFWKNNKVLNSYEDLSKDHTETLKKLEQERDKNNFFILSWFGIK